MTRAWGALADGLAVIGTIVVVALMMTLHLAAWTCLRLGAWLAKAIVR